MAVIPTTIEDFPSAKDHPRLRTRASMEQVEIFAVAFVFDGVSKAEAYRRAFPDKSKNRDQRYIWSSASRFAQNKVVSARIRELEMQQAAHFDYNIEELLKTYHGIAHADLAELYDDDGNLLPLSDIPKHLRRAIKEVKHGVEQKVVGIDPDTGAEITQPTTVVREVKLENKAPALSKLLEMKVLQMGLTARRGDADESTTGYAFARQTNTATPDAETQQSPIESKDIDLQQVARKMLTIMQDAERDGLSAAVMKNMDNENDD